VWFWHLADGQRRDAREEEANHRLLELGRDVQAGLEVVHEEAVAAAQEEEESAAANAVMAAEAEVQAETQRSGHCVPRAVMTTSTVFPAFASDSSSSGSDSSSGGDEDLTTFIEEEETPAANAVMAAEAEELAEALRSKHWIPSAMHGDLIASIELGRERWLAKVAAAREEGETAAANAVLAAEAEEQDEALRSGHWHPLVCPNLVKMVGLRRGLFFPTPPASAPRLEALYEETTMPGSGAGGGGGVYGSAVPRCRDLKEHLRRLQRQQAE
jgi:hypothetical protein